MSGWISDAVARLGADPLLQATLIALSTFVLEDPTTIGSGLLVADGRIALWTAFVGLVLGIALGDIGLYLVGRSFGSRVVGWGWISQSRLDQGSVWFRRNLISAVVLSRFVPGMRTPTYLGAGVLRAPFHRFVLVVIGATLIWTALLLWLTIYLGETILPYLGRYRWPLAIAALAIFVVIQRRAARKLAGTEKSPRPVVSAFEFWPPWLFYIPVGLYYVWLSIRHRGPMLPTIANPSIFTGGLIGESKSQILDLVPPSQQGWVADYTLFERPDVADRGFVVGRARQALERAGLSYPLVAKPDVGQRGAGVQPLRSDADLDRYVSAFPPGSRILFQKLIGEAIPDRVQEAGVLYWRAPGSERGNILSITLKQMPSVVGDGERTLRELIDADPRASRLPEVYLERHAEMADRVLPQGERLPLVFAGNHCQGAIFRDGTPLLTTALLDRIHELARTMPGFYFGRFDLRFDSLEAFLGGEGFRIIEINGAGAEATHIWDASVRLVDAYATLFEQFSILFRIGAANRRLGHRTVGILPFLREARAYRRLARSYPLTH